MFWQVLVKEAAEQFPRDGQPLPIAFGGIAHRGVFGAFSVRLGRFNQQCAHCRAMRKAALIAAVSLAFVVIFAASRAPCR